MRPTVGIPWGRACHNPRLPLLYSGCPCLIRWRAPAFFAGSPFGLWDLAAGQGISGCFPAPPGGAGLTRCWMDAFHRPPTGRSRPSRPGKGHCPNHSPVLFPRPCLHPPSRRQARGGRASHARAGKHIHSCRLSPNAHSTLTRIYCTPRLSQKPGPWPEANPESASFYL